MPTKRFIDFPTGSYDTNKIILQADPITGRLEKVPLPAAVTPDILAGKLDVTKKPVVSTVSGLRALTAPATDVIYQTTDMGGGQWYYDSSDTTSIDNTGTVIVTPDNKRLKRIVQGDYLVKWFGAKGDGSTDETALINNIIQSIPANSNLVFEANKVYNISDKIIIDKAINIIGNQARFNKTTANGTAISIRSSNVSINGLKINGAGNATFIDFADLIITENGSESVFYDSIKIENCTLYNNTKGAMTLSYVTNFSIINNTMYDFPYQGIMILSGKKGLIKGNKITNIHGTGAVNSYGIAASALNITSVSNLSQDIVITENIINSVPLWEGLDTHGGQNISFTYNTITNAKIAISIGSLVTGTVAVSAQNINVSANKIVCDSTVQQTQGIRVTGYSTTDLTQAIVVNNQLKVGFIYFTNTSNSILSSNTISQPNNASGIRVDGFNDKLNINSNIIEDAYAPNGGGNTGAIVIASAATMNGNINGNILKRTSFVPPAGSGIVNSYGVYQFSAGSNIIFGENDFSVATLEEYKNVEQPVKLRGNGSPEGVKAALIGSTYRRLDGTAGATFYIKETGTGNTGWVAVASQTSLNLKADDNAVLHLANTETLTGLKTIQNNLVLDDNDYTHNYGLTIKSYAPTISQNIIRSAAIDGGGFAQSILTASAGLTNTSLTKLFENGIYGTFHTGAGNSTLNYQYFGVGSDTSYSNNNIRLYPNKTVGLMTVNDAVGDFVTRNNSTGLITRRTAVEALSDMGGLSTTVAASTYAPIASPTFTGSISSPSYKLSALNTAPISATDTGTLGEFRSDGNYIYFCKAANTWVRAALTTW